MLRIVDPNGFIESALAGEVSQCPDERGRRTLEVVPGEIDQLATEAENAIRTLGLPVFQRGNSLVEPVSFDVPASHGRMTVSTGLKELTQAGVIDHMAQAARFQQWNRRQKKWVQCNPPSLAANIILSRAGHWSLPGIAGVITTPTLRPDGTLLTAPGYDAVTRLYHTPDPKLVMPDIPKHPTMRHAHNEIERLKKLLIEFPFQGIGSRSVALSGLLSAVARGALSVCPLHVISAATAGTGKSYYGDVVSAICTGRPCPVFSAAESAEETEKRLVGNLLASFPIISIDNVNGELGGDLLCQAVERPLVRVRPLGRSEIVEIESRATLLANGNNIRVRGDMTRRTVICNLDAGMERPEERAFQFDPVQTVLDDRGAYVAACLVIVLAYLDAGQPGKKSPIASFCDWSDLIRSALIWLGEDDPAASMENAREDDPHLVELREFMTLWPKYFGNAQLTVREACEQANERNKTQMGEPTDFKMADMREFMLRIGGARGGVDTLMLSGWLRKHKGRIVGNRRIIKGDNAQGGLTRWRVEEVRR